MEGEYTPTIIRAMLPTDHASILLKPSREISCFSNNYPIETPNDTSPPLGNDTNR